MWAGHASVPASLRPPPRPAGITRLRRLGRHRHRRRCPPTAPARTRPDQHARLPRPTRAHPLLRPTIRSRAQAGPAAPSSSRPSCRAAGRWQRTRQAAGWGRRRPWKVFKARSQNAVGRRRRVATGRAGAQSAAIRCGTCPPSCAAPGPGLRPRSTLHMPPLWAQAQEQAGQTSPSALPLLARAALLRAAPSAQARQAQARRLPRQRVYRSSPPRNGGDRLEMAGRALWGMGASKWGMRKPWQQRHMVQARRGGSALRLRLQRSASSSNPPAWQAAATTQVCRQPRLPPQPLVWRSSSPRAVRLPPSSQA